MKIRERALLSARDSIAVSLIYQSILAFLFTINIYRLDYFF